MKTGVCIKIMRVYKRCMRCMKKPNFSFAKRGCSNTPPCPSKCWVSSYTHTPFHTPT